MDAANTFGNMKPDMKDTYAGKNKRFQKIQSRLRKQHQEHDKKCGCTPKKPKCECKGK
jgi:hypothetical protein